MLLRAGGEMVGKTLDVRAVTAGDGVPSGVEHERELIRFAEAVVAGSPDEIATTRDALRAAVGDAAAVDAAAVVGNFQRMVRIADGTGIPLDTPIRLVSADLRRDLGIDAYPTAAHTPATPGWQRVLGRWMRPLVPMLARRMTKPEEP